MIRTTEASLPAELWIEIFMHIRSVQHLVQCCKVNQRWRQLAEDVMFSKDITLITERDAMAFYHYLMDSRGENQLVKHITMMPQNQPLRYFRDLIPLVVTSSMKTFNGSVESVSFFRVLYNETFGENGLAKFRNVQVIPSPWTYCNIYDDILHRLRYSLKEITLHFREISHDRVPHWKSLVRLNKITQLQVLTFNSYVHDVKKTEFILRNCGHLKHLTIRLAARDLFSGETEVTQWISVNTYQCDTLKELKIRLDNTYSPYFIDYLMYKYPGIESIIVEKMDIKEPWGSYPVTPMDASSIKTTLDKIRKVQKYKLTCQVLDSGKEIIISSLKSDGHLVFGSDQNALYPIVTATNSHSKLETPL